GELNKATQSIVEATRGTRGVVDKLFSTDAGTKEPEFGAIPFVQKLAKNTSQLVPSWLAKIMEHENSTPFFVREDMWHVVQQLSRDARLAIAGAQDLNTKHEANKKSTEARRDALGREIDNFRGFVTNALLSQGAPGIGQALYFSHNVWKQQRVGIETN